MEARVVLGRTGVKIVKNGVWLLAMLMFVGDLVLVAEDSDDLRIKCLYRASEETVKSEYSKEVFGVIKVFEERGEN